MDLFARRVGFTPTRLPAWLTPPPPTTATHDRPAHPTLTRSTTRPEFRFDWSRLLPSLTLYLHFAADDLTSGEGGVVRWEGEGPVTHAFVHEHLRPLHDYVIRPVIDLAHQAPVDAYELPDRLREAVRLLAPSDVFPFAGTAAGTSTWTTPWPTTPPTPPGPNGTGPPGSGTSDPLGRFHHRIKTHGHWVLRQPFAGIYLWRDPHGIVYLQDHTGTHQITPPGQHAGPARSHDPDLEMKRPRFDAAPV